MSLRKLFKTSRGVPHWMLRSWSMKPSMTNKAFFAEINKWMDYHVYSSWTRSTAVWAFSKVFPLSSNLFDNFQTPGFNRRYCCPREMFTFTCNYQRSNPSPLSALDLTPPSSGHSPDVRLSPPPWKSAAVVKDDGEDKQHGGNRGACRREWGPLLFCLSGHSSGVQVVGQSISLSF